MNGDLTKAGLFLVCVITTLIVLLFIAGCAASSVYEVDCDDPFNMCERGDLVNLPSDSA